MFWAGSYAGNTSSRQEVIVQKQFELANFLLPQSRVAHEICNPLLLSCPSRELYWQFWLLVDHIAAVRWLRLDTHGMLCEFSPNEACVGGLAWEC